VKNRFQSLPFKCNLQRYIKALERVELANARERSLAFKREVVRAELKEKMERAAELKVGMGLYKP
jgi:hypothetical protein